MVKMGSKWSARRRARFQQWCYELELKPVDGRIAVPSREHGDNIREMLKERIDRNRDRHISEDEDAYPFPQPLRALSSDLPNLGRTCSVASTSSGTSRSTSVSSVSSEGSVGGSRLKSSVRPRRPPKNPLSSSVDSALGPPPKNLTPMRRSSASFDFDKPGEFEPSEVNELMLEQPGSFRSRRVRSRTMSTDTLGDSPLSARDRFASGRSDSGDGENSNESFGSLFLDARRADLNSGSFEEKEGACSTVTNKMDSMHLFSRRPNGRSPKSLSSHPLPDEPDNSQPLTQAAVEGISSISVNSKLDFVCEMSTTVRSMNDDSDSEDGAASTQSTLPDDENEDYSVPLDDHEEANTSTVSSDCGFTCQGGHVMSDLHEPDAEAPRFYTSRPSIESEGGDHLADAMLGVHSHTRTSCRTLFNWASTPVRDFDVSENYSPDASWASDHPLPPRSGNRPHRGRLRAESWGSHATTLSSTTLTPAPPPIGMNTATAQQTPQAQTWGSRLELGDWGRSEGAERSMLGKLLERLNITHKSMIDKNQLSPCDAALFSKAIREDSAANLPLMPSFTGEEQSPPPASFSTQRRSVGHPSPLGLCQEADGFAEAKSRRVHKRLLRSHKKLHRVSLGRSKALDMSRSLITLSPQTSPKVGSPLNSESFEAVIIGATYSGSFENSAPVVSVCAEQKSKVVNGSLSNAGKIRLTVQYSNSTKSVTLLKSCHAIFAHPSGLLVSNKPINCKGAVAYYLPEELYLGADWISSVLPLPPPPIEPPMVRSARSSTLTPSLESMSIFSPVHTEHTSGARQEQLPSSKLASFVRPAVLNMQLAMEEEEDLMSLSSLPLPPPLAGAPSLLAHLFSYLTVMELFKGPMLGCRCWSRQSVRAHAELVAAASVNISSAKPAKSQAALARVGSMRAPGDLFSRASQGGAIAIKTMQQICVNMPWGSYLSEGAYKKVYSVLNTKGLEWAQEAVSVMDVRNILEVGAGSVVEQEIKVSLLVSSLVRRKECPNFVEIYGVFGADFAPPPDLWGCGENRYPRGKVVPAISRGVGKQHILTNLAKQRCSNSRIKGRHQFIRMELCSHGDVEEFIHAQPMEEMSDDCLLPMAFQMVLSLHAAQTEFNMRHYDVKLLNFLLKEMPPTSKVRRYEGTSVCYGVDGKAFVLKLPSQSSRLWVKLSDFGTADVDPTTYGQPIGLEQFTTLENSPIEQLLLGAGSTQVYAADMWGLGLSLLHLFTGHCPYEELLKDVQCPSEVLTAVQSVWTADEEVFGIVVDAAGEEENGDLDRTLADTLYRYLVIFGIPDQNVFDSCLAWHGNAVWAAILPLLSQQTELPGLLKQRRRKAAKTNCASEFRDHRAVWGLECGGNAVMMKARQRLIAFGGFEVLKRMMAFDATARPSMLDLVHSPLFESLVEPMQPAHHYDHLFLKFL